MAEPGISKPFAAPPVAGGLHSDVAGRTDHLPVSVGDGSYVLPADVVSGLGQGNTTAGIATLDQMFKEGPYGVDKDAGAYGTKLKKFGASSKRGPKAGKRRPPGKPKFAEGGFAQSFDDAMAQPEEPAAPIDIAAAGGEYVLTPEMVTQAGGGDIDHGHKVLDAFVKQVRGDTIKEMKKLPGPAKS